MSVLKIKKDGVWQDVSGLSRHTHTSKDITDLSATIESIKEYADNAANTIKDDLLNGAGEAYDTLKELGELINENSDALEALEEIAVSKAEKDHNHDDIYYTEEEINQKITDINNNISESKNIVKEYIDNVIAQQEDSFFDVNVVVNMLDFSVISISNYYNDIEEAYNEGKTVRAICWFEQFPNDKTIGELTGIGHDVKVCSFNLIIRADFGEGNKFYALTLSVTENKATTIVKQLVTADDVQPKEDAFFDVNAVINPIDFSLVSTSKTFEEIKEAYDAGKQIRVIVEFAGVPNEYTVVCLGGINQNWCVFNAIKYANFGSGLKVYFLQLELGTNDRSVVIVKELLDSISFINGSEVRW